MLLTREKLSDLADAGLCHVQISFQGNEPNVADRVAGLKDSHRKKLDVAKWTRELDLPLTVNAVMHRQNLHQLADIIQMAVDLDADRLEVANVQYYGWALKNRAALMPTLQQIEETSRLVEEAQVRLKGVLAIDYVVPDYYALRPKKCMGGWGRQFFNISPAGKVLPCHAAESITGLEFELVRSQSLHRLDLAELGRLQPLSRHRLDEGAVQVVRVSRDRSRRLPLPGLCAVGRRRQYRSCLHAVADARDDLPAGRAGIRRRAEPLPLSQFRRWDAGGGRRTWRLMPAQAAPIPSAPLTSEQLAVSDGHELYVESVGREGGIPAVYLHGGPGSGCQPDHRRLFDPERFHAVLFDQRGCGRSRPKGSREHNTLRHLIADMEVIRTRIRLSSAGSWPAAPGARRWRWPMRRRIPRASAASCCARPFSAPIAGNRIRLLRSAALLLS